MRIVFHKADVLTSAEEGELTKCGGITGAVYGEFFEDGIAETLGEKILKVEVEKKRDWKVTRTSRIKKIEGESHSIIYCSLQMGTWTARSVHSIGNSQW